MADERRARWGRWGLGACAIAAVIGGASCGAPDAPGAAPAPKTLGAVGRGGSVVLDRAALVAWIADADGAALHRLDLTTGDLATTALPGRPEQVALLREGRVAVTLPETSEVVALAFDAEGHGEVVAEAEVPDDPWGLAVAADGDLLVTSAWGRALTRLDGATLATTWSIPLGREPRGVVVSPDGAKAFVTHVVGDAVSVVDLGVAPAADPAADSRGGKAAPVAHRVSVLGGGVRNRADAAIGAGTLHPTSALAYAAAFNDAATRLFVPHVLEQNGASAARQIPGAYGGVPLEEETSVASVAVVAVAAERVLGDELPAPAPREDARPGVEAPAFVGADAQVGFAVAPPSAPCRQARAVASLGDSLLVASLGTDELVELDARALDPALAVVRRIAVAAGPTGLDVDPATRIAVVWGQLDHALSVVDLDTGAVETTRVADDPLPPDVSAGRRLFLTERDRRISRDGRACNGCHPDGRDDGVVWKLGAGPRQTPTLVGRTTRGPFGWLGKHAELGANMSETMSRLGGTGLSDKDLASLAAYVQRGLRAPGRRVVEDAQAARGRELFTSVEVGCATCHKLETEGSDRAVHVVSSRTKTDTTEGFRTPPLLYVGGTAPYFHDGRYATLEQLLEDDLDRMGQTTQLSKADVAALAAFLRTL